MFSEIKYWSIIICVGLISASCTKKIVPADNPVPVDTTGSVTSAGIEYSLTTPDQANLLAKQPNKLMFSSSASSGQIIKTDTAKKYQAVDGFGYSLTGGSAYVINHLPLTVKSDLLQELFGTGDNTISVSYLRISIGASDLDADVFSYDDLPPGQTDESLDHFTLDPDRQDLVPLLKEILAINPSIKILGSPWSPPVWMKDNDSSKGGSLLPKYYDAYARYFVKYIQQMKIEGINIDAITPQNEPLNPKNNPSLLILAEQERDFIKNNLGPAFAAAGINTKIITYDHNCDHPDYPLTILQDADARKYVNGSAFHLYAGDISALSQVHNAFPDKHVYFTEQWTGSKETFDGNLQWHVKNVIIGSMRNWSRIALEWNLASDENYGPHTEGGCTECKGALTISNGSVQKRVGYYIIAHASKFVPPGSVRIESNIPGNLQNVAFLTPAGKKVLIVMNDNTAASTFSINDMGKFAQMTLPGGGVGTFVWE